MATNAEREEEYRIATKEEQIGLPEDDPLPLSASKEFVLKRRSDVPLRFRGWLLADVSSEHDEPNKQRWQTIRIWRSTSGRLIVEEIGHSRIPGEKDFVKIVNAETPERVREFLRKEGKHGPYLSDLAMEALEDAAATDPAMEAALSERA